MRARSLVLTSAIAAPLTLLGCGGGGTPSGDALTGAQKVEAIASTLQSCSYDGRPMTVEPAALNGDAPNECAVAVQRIMSFTGLPSNFVVVSGPVDNAAAVILLDDKRVPRRVIAFNPEFLAKARALVGGSPWGPVSVMAHEIAHHLSGHTIVPGGSRPNIELEADKFSGFVLQKMGAPLDAATQMILKVGSDHASATHPAKGQRADAIKQGWIESCQQNRGSNCAVGAVQPAAPVSASTQMPQPSSSAAIVSPAPATGPLLGRKLPASGSIPFKYGRFVADETGRLDPARVRTMDQQLYALAKDAGVEFTILIVDDLRGMSAQDFAWAMMRQLRVGKLDVGNGAVAVVAPRQRQAAVAFGPGLAKEAEFSKPDRQLLDWIGSAWRYCEDADGCAGWTDTLFNIFGPTLSNASKTKWTIEYQTLGQLMARYQARNDERQRTKRPFDPVTDQPLGNLIRVTGRITSLDPPHGPGQANPKLLGGSLGYTAVSMTTDDGYPLILYVTPQLPGLMPAGPIKANARYTAVGRLQRTGDKAKQAGAMWLFSYDEL